MLPPEGADQLRHLIKVFIYAPVPLFPLAARGRTYYALPRRAKTARLLPETGGLPMLIR